MMPFFVRVELPVMMLVMVLVLAKTLPLYNQPHINLHVFQLPYACSASLRQIVVVCIYDVWGLAAVDSLARVI
jgi:hypothetical protein